MRLPLLVIILAGPCTAQIANNTSQTYDSGMVTCVAGTTSLMYTYGSAGSAALGTYSANTYSAVPGEPVRTMVFCYNTADGLSNKNRTIINTSKGGNIGTYGANANCLWCVNFDTTNGTVPSWMLSAVEGTANAFNVHYNVIFPQYTFSAAGQLNAAQTDTTSGPGVINNINQPSFWPPSSLVSGSAPYVLHFATGEKEEVTATTGTGPFTVTSFVRGFGGTTATTHTTSELFWLEDTSGVGIGYPGSICDLAVLAAYLSNVMGNGNVPGTKDGLLCLGWSNGGFLCQELNQVGHSILKNGSCNSDYADNGFVIQKIAAISSKPDMGATTTMTTWAPGAPSPYSVTADGTEPNTGTASTGWNSAGFPAYSTITLTSPYTISGLPTTGANAGYTQAKLWSPQFNQPGNCLSPVGCDPHPGAEYLVCGQADTDVSCLPQHVFGTTTLIPTILSEQASVGHTANFDDNNGVGTGCGASGNSQACANGAVMQGIMRFFASGGIGSASPAGSGASGSSGGIF